MLKMGHFQPVLQWGLKSIIFFHVELDVIKGSSTK
jgi:hypothetical protein